MKWSFYEIYKNKIFILITFVLSIFFVSLFWRRNPVNYTIARYNYYYFFVASVGMLFISTRIFTNDIKTGVIKTLFTGKLSRMNIFFKRLINTLSVAVIFFLGSQVISVISMYRLYNKFDFNLLITSFIPTLSIYILNMCIISLYVCIISYSFKNQKQIYVLTILIPMIIRYFIPLLMFLSKKNSTKIFSNVLSVFPTTILINWSNSWEITLTQLFIFVAWLIILFIGVNFSVNKMEI